RIVPQNASPAGLAGARQPALNRLNGNQLCTALQSSNAWVRTTAFRLLLEQKDESLVPVLRRMAGNIHSLAQARVAELRLLNCMGGLDLSTLESALDDPHAGVREQALQLAQARCQASAPLLNHVARLGNDPDAR